LGVRTIAGAPVGRRRRPAFLPQVDRVAERVRAHRLVSRLGDRLWTIPALGLVAGFALSVVTVAVDRHVHRPLLPQALVGSAGDAQAILQTIATSVVTLTSIVLTVTLVAVQLAMGQFSPRIVRALLDDRGDQVAVAIFAATFTFAIFSLRGVDTGGGVLGVTVITAFALATGSGIALFLYVDHTARQLRVGGLLELVGNELRRELDSRFPHVTARADDPSVVTAGVSGNVIYVDHERLVAEARRVDCRLELVPAMGDFVPHGAPLLRGDRPLPDRERLLRLVDLDDERTHRDDPPYGIRKLVDVAQRALGTSSNDATTATQTINRLHDCLRQIADRPLPSGRFHDAAGELRLVVRMLHWDGYVRLAFDEIRLAAPGYPQVTRRLVAAIEDLKTIAPPDRHAPLDRQLRLLERAVRQTLAGEDAEAALVPDAQGIGSGADVAT
jgi:uncharacterized membrane protein